MILASLQFSFSRLDQLSSLRKELEDAIAEKNDLLMSRDAGSSDDEDEDDDGSGEDSTDSTSSASELDWQVQERVERFREELTRIHSINTIGRSASTI